MDKRLSVINGKKQCRVCLEWLDVENFGTFLDKKTSNTYHVSRCRKCAVVVSMRWRNKNKERVIKTGIEYRKKLLQRVLDAYGNQCACCGESNELFLTIDHKNDDGYKLRQRNKMSYPITSGNWYSQIIKAGFPDDLQILCWNCNCGRYRNKGVCPHAHSNSR